MDWLALYLEEDLGPGDATGALFDSGEQGSARIVAREGGLAAGVAAACEIFMRMGVIPEPRLEDGDDMAAGDVLAEVHGPVAGILAAERTALNLVARMSGIATHTRQLADALAQAGCRARIAGTRKTTPGFRAFEKEAIALGGGDPHRMGLFDAMMIKDNHRAAAGDLAMAVQRLLEAHPDLELEVEVESLEDALVAAEAGAHWLLIDNQEPETGKKWAEQVWKRFPDIRIEASGGITIDRLTEFGWAHRISMGRLSQAPSLDVGLDWGSA